MKRAVSSFVTCWLLLWSSIATPSVVVPSVATATVLAHSLVATTDVRAATGDVSLIVNPDGWSGLLTVEGFSTGASYDFGLGPDNTITGNEKLILTVTSLGFSQTGAPTTKVRTVVVKSTVRKAFPNEAQVDETGGGNLTTRVAFDFPICAKDKAGAGNSGVDVAAVAFPGLVTNTGGGGQLSNANPSFVVVNNSTLPYPKVVGDWAQPSFERWVGPKLIEMVCYQPFGENRKPVACVAFDCTDGANPITQIVDTTCEASTQWTGVGNVVWTYSATIPTSGFTQGATLTGRFRAYPWVGDSSSVLDSDTSADGVAAPSALLTPLMGLCDKNDSLAVYACVDGTNGSAGGTASASKATARGSRFQTLAQALTAAKATNNSLNSDNSLNNCYILMYGGTYSAAGTFTGSNTKTWCEVAADVENGVTEASVDFATATNQAFNGYIKYKDVKFSGTGSGMFRGNVTTGCLWIDSCTYNHSVAAQWYSWNTAYLTGTTFTAISQHILGSGSGSVGWGLIRQNDLTATISRQGCANCLIGNKQITATFALAGGTNGPQSDGAFVGWNSAYSLGSTTQFLNSFITGNWTRGVAVVGNVAERISGNTTPLCQVLADGTTSSVGNNFYFAHNTFVGARLNFNYLELGNYSPNRYNWFDQYNVVSDWNCKTDVFSNAIRTVTDGVIVAGSPIVNSTAANFIAGDVGQTISFDDNQIPNAIATISSVSAPNATMSVNANINASGVTLYIRNYGKNRNRTSNWAMVNGVGQRGLRARISNFPPEKWGINSKAGTISFVDDRSFDVAGSGGGDYRPAVGSSLLNTVPSGGAVLPGDLTGQPISNTGSGASGALQLTSTTNGLLNIKKKR